MICPYCHGQVTVLSATRVHCVRCEMFMPRSIALEDDTDLPDQFLPEELDNRGSLLLREAIFRQAIEDLDWAWHTRKIFEMLPIDPKTWTEEQITAVRKIHLAVETYNEIIQFIKEESPLLNQDVVLNTDTITRQIIQHMKARYGALSKFRYDTNHKRIEKLQKEGKIPKFWKKKREEL